MGRCLVYRQFSGSQSPGKHLQNADKLDDTGGIREVNTHLTSSRDGVSTGPK